VQLSDQTEMKQSTSIRWAAAAVVGLAVMLLVYFFGKQPEVETPRQPIAPDRPPAQTWLSPQLGTAPVSTPTVRDNSATTYRSREAATEQALIECTSA
jgi:hypothetical protein